MAFPPEFLRELEARNPIEEVASAYVNLKRRGKNLVGLCPFHNEKTPSFCIYPENNSFFCFGCNKGGDVISFVMGVENLDFPEAVRWLAQRAGMTVPEDGVDDSMSRLRTRILEINRESGRFYYSVLSTPEGKAGVEYFRRRGLARSIGVSNYHIHHLEDVLREAEVVPAVDQVECHPELTQVELADFCAGKGIAFEPWSPLGAGKLLEDPELLSIAASYGKTVAQVILRWGLQRGFICIPKSVHRERIESNAQVFDFELSAADMDRIFALNKNARVGADPETFPF